MATNCWEFKKCGREPGGAKEAELGTCPAATLTLADGFLGGKNGGRACAYVAGTLCGGTVQGTHLDKAKKCEACDFFVQLRKDHPADCSAIGFMKHAKSAMAKR